MVILDTDAFTDLYYGRPTPTAKLAEARRVEPTLIVGVSVITWYELYRGRCESLVKSANRQELIAAMQRFLQTQRMLDQYPILMIDDIAAGHFERLRAQKKLKISATDLLIACTALSQNALLVTRNLKDYKNIQGLRVENWDQ